MKRLLLALMLVAGAAQASPWAEGGDRQFRQDIEMLKAARIIRGPINAWPLPWAQIDNGIAFNEGVVLPPHLAAALARVKAHSDMAQRRTVYEFKAAGTTDPQLVRDFGGGARENADVSVRATHDVGPLYVSYGVGYRNGQRGKDFHLDPTYAAVQIGNWALYGGYVEEWFGSGHDGALLFSNSARPFPKVGIKRLSPDPIPLPVLKWLGPIRLDVFAGVLTEKRDFDNTGIIGIRVAFEPVHGLEIGLNRGLQLCGRGRPCDLKTIGKALVGFGNADNTGTPNEPGNQLAGFDISFTRNIGTVTAQFYAEAEAEDEDNLLIEQFARLAGVALSGPLGKQGASWNANLEVTDSLGAKLFGSGEFPGSLYNNFIYLDGFTYKREPIGYSLDEDTRTITLAGAVNDTKNRRWYASLRDINLFRSNAPPLVPSGLPRSRVTRTPETIQVATAGVEWPSQFGDIRVEGRLQNDGPDTPGTSKLTPAIELAFRSRF